MKTRVTLSGGFHNVEPISVMIETARFEMYKEGRIFFDDALTESQRRRLKRHFCGIEECCCGGYEGKNVKIEY